ncbi:hypothetical protein [Sulfurovum sp.]|uniref:hypothetical protein n=1 Tax=Sulfurovum sp. TaxID=1969726 RepID=UPI00356139CA
MSGGDSTGGGGVIAPSEDCSDIVIKVRLSSVNASILKTVHIKDILKIKKEGASLVAVKGSDIVGAIASIDVIKLKKCIDEGYEYTGLVVEKEEGKCILVITPNNKI